MSDKYNIQMCKEPEPIRLKVQVENDRFVHVVYQTRFNEFKAYTDAGELSTLPANVQREIIKAIHEDILRRSEAKRKE